MSAEEDVEADAGMTVVCAINGATGLMRTAGRTNLARAPGGTRLVRIAPRGNTGLPPLPPPRRNDNPHQYEGAGGFQETRAIACILGGAQAPASQRIFK